MISSFSSKDLVFVYMATGVLIHNQRVFIQKRNSNDNIWAGLWEFPGGVMEAGESPEQTVTREFLEETGLEVLTTNSLGNFKHAHTNFRVTMHAFSVELQTTPRIIHLTAAQEYRWATWAQVKALAFPTGHRLLISYLDASLDFRAKILP